MAAFRQPSIAPNRPWFPVLLCAAGAAGLASVLLVAYGHWHPAYLVVMPLAVAALVLLIADTQIGLCFAAFSIAPLGIVQQEVWEVTLGLPEVVILALVLKEVARRTVRPARRRELLPPMSLLPYLAAAAIGLVTGLALDNGTIPVLQDFRQFVEYLTLYWLVVRCVTTRQQVAQVATCFVVGCTVLAVDALLQQFTLRGIPVTQLANDLILYQGIRSGSFYGATPLGGIMVLALGAAAGRLFAADTCRMRVVMAVCIGLCLLAMVLTKTRAAWLAALLALGFLAVSVRVPRRIVAIMAVAAVGFAVLLGPAVYRRLGSLDTLRTDLALLERGGYYRAAWHIFRTHPVLGLGWGCYYDVDQILEGQRYLRTPRPSRDSTATVHSAYLQLLVKAGLLGLLGFLVFLCDWLRAILRERAAKSRAGPDHGLFIGITAGLIGYLFQCTFENFFQWPVMAQSLWLLFGLAMATAAIIRSKAKQDAPSA